MTRLESIARDSFIWLMLAGVFVLCLIAMMVGSVAHLVFLACDYVIEKSAEWQEAIER